MTERKRCVSGMRPTGKLHLGHLAGVLRNWKTLQDEYDCFFMVADWHALMSEYAHPEPLRQWTVENVLDWLAAGINPARSVIFRQSDVPEHLELYTILSILTPLGWVERVPTYKEQLRELEGRELTTHGFLGYPILQAADILLYRAHVVPVGEDQLPHLELTRELVRRVHALYQTTLFPEPKSLLTPTPKLLGTDGRKMSKSYGNTISLSESPEGIRKLAQSMFTDPTRIKMTDPGHPETCNVCGYWKIFAPTRAEAVWEECRTSTRGCAQNKQELSQTLIEQTEPFRAFRARVGASAEGQVEAILHAGAQRARVVAADTIRRVREMMGLSRSPCATK